MLLREETKARFFNCAHHIIYRRRTSIAKVRVERHIAKVAAVVFHREQLIFRKYPYICL